MSIQYKGHDLVFGLDIGTRSIVGTVGYRVENRFKVVAQSVKYHETRAMLDGQIHDIHKVGETIRQVKLEIEDQIGQELHDVCIAAAGRVLKTAIGHHEEELEEETILNNEQIYSLELLGIEDANEEIIAKNDTDDKFLCVGYTVIHYYLNGFSITNLEGHKARKMGVDVLATFLPEDVIDGLYQAVAYADLEVVNLTLEPIAAMNVAIPEQYRLLNIALVDVGAGTSDICITKDGAVIAYGMIPYAGDRFTETLARQYLVDFDTAEKIKMMPAKRKTMTYKDIMGDKQKLTREQLDKDLKESLFECTSLISDKIKELNGGKSVSAVFIVGGGGKVPGFTEQLAKQLKLTSARVAIRGQEVMGQIDMLDETLKKDALFVTPIGICLNYYEKKNNFIFVQVNKQRAKLYDNNHLTVMDAAAAIGYPNELLFPRRGEDLTFTINKKSRIKRGNKGESAVITLNGEIVSMTSPIVQNDKIEIQESTFGTKASLEVSQLPECSSEIHFRVNGQVITCPKYVSVNNEVVSPYYEIQSGDVVEVLDYYTVEQLLSFLDIDSSVSFYINHESASLNDKIFDQYMINWAENAAALEQVEKDHTSNLVSDFQEEKKKEQNQIKTTKEETTKKEPNTSIQIQVNDDTVTLSGKRNYIFVDILDVYDFDLSAMGGEQLITTQNGVSVDFTVPISEGDVIKIYWKG